MNSLEVNNVYFRQGEPVCEVVERISKLEAPNFILFEIHGSENGGEELLYFQMIQKTFEVQLAVLIHRPEEFFLRVAHQHGFSFHQAKQYVKTIFSSVDLIVVLLETAIKDLGYDKIFQCRVQSIPHGAFDAIPISQNKLNWRYKEDSIVFIGSQTTWGEMRDIMDVHSLISEVNKSRRELSIRIVPWISGRYDSRININEYASHTDFKVISNLDILNAGPFDTEAQFREAIWKLCRSKIIIRMESFEEGTSEEERRLWEWENACIDFNVQMYHENPDLRDLRLPHLQGDVPKYEASGTLHKGKPEIFVVSDSPCMRQDVGEREGYQLVFVPNKKGQYDFVAPAKDIISLILNPTKRIEILQHNYQTSLSSNMTTIASQYLQALPQ